MGAAPTAKVQATQLKFVVEDERRVPRKRRNRIPKGRTNNNRIIQAIIASKNMNIIFWNTKNRLDC